MICCCFKSGRDNQNVFLTTKGCSLTRKLKSYWLPVRLLWGVDIDVFICRGINDVKDMYRWWRISWLYNSFFLCTMIEENISSTFSEGSEGMAYSVCNSLGLQFHRHGFETQLRSTVIRFPLLSILCLLCWSSTDPLRQFYMLPHSDKNCRSNVTPQSGTVDKMLDTSRISSLIPTSMLTLTQGHKVMGELELVQ